MMTSALLFDDSGNRINDWCTYFSAAPHQDDPKDVAQASVVHSLLIEGQLEHFHQTPLSDFVQVIERPFEIDAVECLYLNQDSIYDDEMIAALMQFTRTPKEVLVALVPILPAELAGAGLLLDRKMLNAFKRGYPIWRRGALSCAPGRGERGWSGASNLLRKAIRSWTIISELAVRQSLYRAKDEGLTPEDRDLNVRETSKDLVQYFLGYSPSGSLVDISVSEQNVDRIVLDAFNLDAIRRDARRDRAPTARSVKDPGKAIRPSDYSKRISRQLKKDVQNFEVLNPQCGFDAYAIAGWNLRVLLWLRLVYSRSMAMDKKRSKSREKLVCASNSEDRGAIARRFSDRAYRGIKAGRKSNGLMKTAWVSHVEMMGASETALIAFFADIDPRFIRAQLYPRSSEDQDALFETARWLGTLYRYRSNYLTQPQAQNYLYLLNRIVNSVKGEGSDEEVEELGIAFRMITSFIAPLGLSRLEAAAKFTVANNVGRTIHAIDLDYESTEGCQAPICALNWPIEHNDVHPGFDASAIPLPVFIPAGRLLIPGDYVETWVGRSRSLMDLLTVWHQESREDA